MNPMEQMAVNMLGKLTGLTPEQMQELATKGMALLQSVETRLANIERGIAELHAIHAIKSDPVMLELLSDERQSENVN